MVRYDGGTIRHLERHQGVPLDFHYVDKSTGDEFDVTKFTDKMLGSVPRSSVLDSHNRTAHGKLIHNAIDAGVRLRLAPGTGEPEVLADSGGEALVVPKSARQTVG